jgi:trypsin
MRRWQFMVAGIAALTLSSAEAIVIRHDQEDRRYVELARQFPATVVFHQKDSGFGMDGIGTLIDARWVLTAGHIVAELKPGDIAEVGGARYEIEELVQHPLWQGIKKWEDVQHDIALVHLRKAVRGVKPALLYTKPDELGLTLTIAGSGRFGNGLTGPTTDDLTMRAATNRVLRVEGTQLVFRFDSPDDPDVTVLEGISGDGDSGGPAYLVSNGKIYVVGVGSAQDARPVDRQLGHYGVLELYPRVSSFVPWIRETIKKNGGRK